MDKWEYRKRQNLKQEICLKIEVASIDEKMKGSLIWFGYILRRASHEPVSVINDMYCHLHLIWEEIME